jgi:hypothetical protein
MSQPCAAFDAKVIWIEAQKPVDGTFMVYYERPK